MKQQDDLIKALREENLGLKQANSELTLSETQHKELLLAMKEQVEKKTKDFENMASDLGKTREKLSETETSLVLSKDQLRLVEEALSEIRASKQEE